MIATGKWSENDPLDIPANLAHSASSFQRLNNFTMTEIEEKLSTYNTLIVVRHPFERLLSAYRNKLETRDEKSSRYFQTRFGRKIVKVQNTKFAITGFVKKFPMIVWTCLSAFLMTIF